jgi:rubrerythrin
MGKELTTHIKEESKMLNQAIEISARAIEISKSIKDEKFKWILERIVEDERNHHKILRSSLKS